MRLAISLAVPLLFAFAAHADAQVAGTVRGAQGAPLVAASVEGWGSTTRLFRTLTDEQGRFAATWASGIPVVRLTVGLIGYRTMTVGLSAGSRDGLSIQLAVEPIPLPQLLVIASRSGCAADEDPVARDLWRRASERYSQETIRRGGAVMVHTSRGEVPEFEVGHVDAPRSEGSEERWAGAVWPVSGEERADISERVLARGYVEGKRGGWVYPHLGGADASHFASLSFGSLHVFRVVEKKPNHTTLQFCPRSDGRGSVSGRLVLDNEGRLLQGTWMFKSQDATQDAGGEVVFGEFRDPENGELHLVSARGVFWRQMPGKRGPGGQSVYFQVSQVFDSWFVGPDDTEPSAGRLEAGRAVGETPMKPMLLHGGLWAR